MKLRHDAHHELEAPTVPMSAATVVNVETFVVVMGIDGAVGEEVDEATIMGESISVGGCAVSREIEVQREIERESIQGNSEKTKLLTDSKSVHTNNATKEGMGWVEKERERERRGDDKEWTN